MANGVTSFNSSSSNGSNDLDYFTKCASLPLGYQFWEYFSIASFLVGFPISLMVILELLRRRRQNAKNDLFIFNLTVMDLTFTIIMPFSVCDFMIWQNITFEFISNVIYNLALCSRPLFMSCICLDCYFAVVHPIIYMTNKTSSILRKAACTVVWLITVCFSFYMAATPGAFTTPLFSLPFIIALPVITFCDVSILRALRKPDPTAKSSIHPQKKRALHTIVNSFLMTFIVYVPPLIIFLFGEMLPMPKIYYTCILVMFGLCFSMAGCVIMPILYLDTLGKLDVLKDWWHTLKYSWL